MENFKSEIPLAKLFSDTIFRIPDYQRGYSWGTKQLDDLWEDIENLYQANMHYTGLITVTKGLTEDAWTGRETYYIVDGQQRLTTLVILLKVILNKAKRLGLEELDNIPLQTLTKKYLYVEHDNNAATKSAVFGYMLDDPSNEYFQSKILEIKQPSNEVSTFYTKGLERAKRYSEDKIKNCDKIQLEKIFKIVTNKLVFNEYIVTDQKEVSMVFESMNNRGKPLSTLELLKNRLLYISEKLDLDSEVENRLRSNINKAWKIVYEWLGKEELLEDDEFLRVHWIMYYEYDRTKSKAFSENLLNEIFTVKRAYKRELDYDAIDKYITSLSDAVKHWYCMNYPEKNVKGYTDPIVNELARLNRIGYTTFKPLVMALLLKTDGQKDAETVSNIFKKCEEYIFKVLAISVKASNTGDSYFYVLSKKYYDGDKDYSTILKDIDARINREYRLQSFVDTIDELFEDHDGFYSWGYLKYFLFEYDLSLKENSMGGTGRSIRWDDYENVKKYYVSVEHIYPQDDKKECWQKTFGRFSELERNILKGSLGNLLPLSVNRNSSFQNNCFDEKKDNSSGAGYYNGSYSETEIVNLYKEWTPETIFERGMKLLEFMEKRWNLELPEQVKKSLLHLEFLTTGVKT